MLLFVLICSVIIVSLILLGLHSNFRACIRDFKRGSVCVTGMRGSGKDMLMSNIVSHRKEPYVSNIEYVYKHNDYCYYPFEYDKINLNNTYDNFINGNINKYVFPYPDGTDIYISDLGVYFPSQYCNELNKKYSSLPTFGALSRHLGLSNLHLNVQNLNRAFDKLRELSDTYYYCRECKVFFGKLVFQKITVYDKASSCIERVKPCRITVPLFAKKEVKENARMYREKFYNQYGLVKSRTMFYINRSKYDTRVFKKMLEEGV